MVAVYDVYNKRTINKNICGTLTAHGNASTTSSGTFFVIEDFYKNRNLRVYEKIAPTIRAEREGLKVVNGFYKQALETAEKGNAKPGDIIDAFNGKVNKSGVSPTITTRPEGKKTAILPCVGKYRIRKLTPRECWRLMGYSDEDFEKAQAVNSNTQLYKQAGNAIVKQVLMAIFSQMNIKGVTPWNKRK